MHEVREDLRRRIALVPARSRYERRKEPEER